MKKVIFSFIGAAIIIGAVVFNISISSRSDSLSDIALANVEALATGEINPDCPNGCVDGSSGCYCREYYSYYSEYTGW